MGDDSVDHRHARPEGVSDEAVTASGRFAEALAYVERARGHLYSFHRLIGEADLLLDEVVDNLKASGNSQLAVRVADELVGRNVLPGRWTFQVVEEFDDDYYARFVDLERAVRDETVAGRRHVFEAEMKQRRHTPGRAGRDEAPGDVGVGEVV